ncbi:MAG TPA: two-component sensor histidine kinase [Bacteroidales bacterium]|nr:two-component sensor histidine kinase [Bacteroidales bacterium]
MKISLRKEISVYIALAAAIFSGITILIFISGKNDYLYLYPMGTILIVFSFVYFSTNIILKRGTVERARTLFDNVNWTSEGLSELDSYNLINKVNQEVLSLASNQTREIDRLKEMEKYRKEYLGNVSHELKTPIFNIQGYVLTLLDGGLEDPSINRKYLERTEKSINRLISIIEDLETISRHEAGELRLEKEDFNIVQVVEEIFEAQEIRATKRDIKLIFDKKYKTPIFVNADKMRIFQVLTNLITNSIYYGKSDGRTRVSFTEDRHKVYIEVNDNGIGIAESDISRVFERFYRVDKSRSREQGGTGLGLAIVKHILEAHNETIRVKSKLDRGTSFTFSLSRVES